MFIVPVARRAVPVSRHLDRVVDDAFERFFGTVTGAADTVRRPALDLAEADGHYTVTLDLPGVRRDDVKVAIDGRRVSVAAERRSATPEAAPAAAEGASTDATPATAVVETPAERLVVRERAAASFARAFTLPVEIDQAASGAKLEDGVLTLTLVKRAPTATQLTVR